MKLAMALRTARVIPTTLAQVRPASSPTPARATTIPRIRRIHPPSGDVELEQVLAGGQVEVVVDERHQPGDSLEDADQDHHHRGEQDKTDRRAWRGLLLPASGVSRRPVCHLNSSLRTAGRIAPVSAARTHTRPTERSHRAWSRSSPAWDESPPAPGLALTLPQV